VFYPDEEQATVAHPTTGSDGEFSENPEAAVEPAEHSEPGSPVHPIPPHGGHGDASPHTPGQSISGSNEENIIQWATPPTGGEVDSEGVPQRYRTIPDLLESTEPYQLEYSGVCLVAAEEPCTVDQALSELCWRNAMKAEMQAIETNKT